MDVAAYLYAILYWLAIVNLAMVLVCTFLLAWGGYLAHRLRELPIPELDRWPTVSLVAPARNEERNIERAVRSLVQLDYPHLEITLVNDRSTDRTGEILDRLVAEFPQLNVVHLTELPAGWLGKNHAMQLGADRSRGEWLLFTDADIVFEPSTLRRAIGFALAHQIDHMAATPDTRMPSWLLKSFVVAFGVYFSLFVRVWAIRNPRSTAHVGIGAFNLVRAAVYRAVGGHEKIRMRPDDDIKLGKIIKLAGHRQDLVDGGGMIAVDWYHSLGELIRGLEKNTFSAIEYSVPFAMFSTFSILLLNVWPFVAIFVVPGPARWIYAAVCLGLWFMTWLMAVGMRAPQSCALAFPLAALLFVYIQWRTMLLNLYHNGIRWRDTHYSLAELRANRV
ncbi:MAG: glycosyltransferase family 2 protein [Planctomycetaceae bacterium]|nr:glycosyltransferase family 2 protein [Planctomycetaceae bacterium]